MTVDIFQHGIEENGKLKVVETIGPDRMIRMSEIADSYPGYVIRDVTFLNTCDVAHVYLAKAEKEL